MLNIIWKWNKNYSAQLNNVNNVVNTEINRKNVEPGIRITQDGQSKKGNTKH